ncbi:hypothetical protein QII46_gp1, partial [ssRNA phage Gerhypos.1_41]
PFGLPRTPLVGCEYLANYGLGIVDDLST